MKANLSANGLSVREPRIQVGYKWMYINMYTTAFEFKSELVSVLSVNVDD